MDLIETRQDKTKRNLFSGEFEDNELEKLYVSHTTLKRDIAEN